METRWWKFWTNGWRNIIRYFMAAISYAISIPDRAFIQQVSSGSYIDHKAFVEKVVWIWNLGHWSSFDFFLLHRSELYCDQIPKSCLSLTFRWRRGACKHWNINKQKGNIMLFTTFCCNRSRMLVYLCN